MFFFGSEFVLDSRTVSRSSLPLPDLFGKNLVDVPTMADIMNFSAAGDIVDTVNHPIALGAKRQIAG
jgi:hypothetical protein